MAGQDIQELSLGSQWTTTITYSFLDAFPNYYTSSNQATVGNFGAFSDAQKQVVKNLLDYVQTITGITFQAVDPSSGSVGDITFGTGSNILQGEPGKTFSTGIGQAGIGGDVWIRPDMDIAAFATTVLHEIGHALGLKHGNAGGETIPSQPYLSNDETFYSYSIMLSGEHSSVYANIPQVPVFGLYDVEELQHLYGAGTANSGDTTYSYSTPTRATIWDAGGEDTLSAVSASRGALINLNQTKFSSIINDQGFKPDNPANNISIAYGAVIENAVGSSSADIIIGNSSKNKLDGGDGDDLIFGDEVVAKQIMPDGPFRGYQIDAETFWFKGAHQVDGTTDTDDSDKIQGGAGADWIYGGNGDDELTGGAGNDFLDGGAGTDTAIYDDATAAQTITIQTGTLPDGAKADGSGGLLRIARGSEVDVLHSVEKLKLSAQADTVEIGAGTDLSNLKEIDGGANPSGANAGLDTLDISKLGAGYTISNGFLVGSGSNQGVNVKILNFEKVVGLSSDDSIGLQPGVKEAHGGDGNDTITGTSTSAVLFGEEGNDILIAGTAGDILDGGGSTGDGSDPSDGDQYTGGAGADTFVVGNGVHARHGTDSIFLVQNAGMDDRIVLRLSDTSSDASAWTKGIVLNGGVQPTTFQSNPNLLTAFYSPTIVNPVIGSGGDGASVESLSTQNTRSALGDFFVMYTWDKVANFLEIDITAAYGDFEIAVPNYQAGQLGLNFTDVAVPETAILQGSTSAQTLQAHWDAYNSAVSTLSQKAQLIDLPSPGEPAEGQASAWTPSAATEENGRFPQSLFLPVGDAEARSRDTFMPFDIFGWMRERFAPPANPLVDGGVARSQMSQLVQAMASFAPANSAALAEPGASSAQSDWTQSSTLAISVRV